MPNGVRRVQYYITMVDGVLRHSARVWGVGVYAEDYDRGCLDHLYEFMTVVLGEATTFDVLCMNPRSIALTSFLFQFVMAIPFLWLRKYIGDRCYRIRYSGRVGPSALAQ